MNLKIEESQQQLSLTVPMMPKIEAVLVTWRSIGKLIFDNIVALVEKVDLGESLAHLINFII